jgi:hypothetical protein
MKSLTEDQHCLQLLPACFQHQKPVLNILIKANNKKCNQEPTILKLSFVVSNDEIFWHQRFKKS